jgi:hypothetical protein
MRVAFAICSIYALIFIYAPKCGHLSACSVRPPPLPPTHLLPPSSYSMCPIVGILSVHRVFFTTTYEYEGLTFDFI